MAKINPRHIPRPRWPEPYDTPIVVAGFEILGYLGFLPANDIKKKYHKYSVICKTCRRLFVRCQAGLVRAQKLDKSGCEACDNPYYKRSIDERETEDNRKWHVCEEWKRFLFTMPVTSLRFRDAVGRSFDSEKSKVMGWRLI